MDLLVLGGTQWLGREVSRQALARGHAVTCLARGTGAVADGAVLVPADRDEPEAYASVAGREWGAVVDVSWQPGQVRSAVAALGERARHWTYVSSISAYAVHDVPDLDESAPLAEPLAGDTAEWEDYAGAKVACETAVLDALGDRALVARAGLIGGPGDETGRGGYWVARAARDAGPMLVPDSGPDLWAQAIDVRDLAAWIVASAETAQGGVFDAVGERVPFTEWVALSRELGGHTGGTVLADEAWLTGQGVRGWAGPDSLPLWIAEPAMRHLCARTGAAAAAAGLVQRPLREQLADVLADERARGLDRERRAGLSPAKEAELLRAC